MDDAFKKYIPDALWFTALELSTLCFVVIAFAHANPDKGAIVVVMATFVTIIVSLSFWYACLKNQRQDGPMGIVVAVWWLAVGIAWLPSAF